MAVKVLHLYALIHCHDTTLVEDYAWIVKLPECIPFKNSLGKRN